MKYLPCRTCRQTALATRGGILHTAGQLSSPTIRYLCRRCGRLSSLSSLEFAALPAMTLAEITHASCDVDVASLDATETVKLKPVPLPSPPSPPPSDPLQ